MPYKPNRQDRRKFLKQCVRYSLAGAGAYATMSSMGMVKAMAADTSGYKALVCIFLYGGNDSFNMVVPRSTAAYDQYAQVRQTLAVPKEALLPINPSTTDGADYGFHPAMPEVQSLFETDKLAVVANVGALVEPTNRNDYKNKTVAVPPRLFSHNDQQDFWQSLNTDGTLPTGWVGRMADLLSSANQNPDLSMNISLSGSNLLQVGNSTIPYFMSPGGVITIKTLDPISSNAQERRRAAAYDAILSNQTGHLFGDQFAKLKRRAIDLSVEVEGALGRINPITTVFPAENKLGVALKTVANMIAARNELGFSRQIFFVGVGGWDTHSDQLTRHPALLTEVSQAMSAFYQATEELQVSGDVTTFTASDFGRTLTTNGDGSDHGWGSHQLVMGGGVKGGDIYGQMPELAIEGPQDSGRGRIIPTSSIDQYSATLAGWFGVSPSESQDIFPNLANFNNTDMGFML